MSGIIYLLLANGTWAYLCAFQHVAGKHVVGWHVAVTMPETFVTTALQRAFLAQLPHARIAQAWGGGLGRALRSQSRRDKCYDKAQVESLWPLLATMVLELREWSVCADLADYFDCYDYERMHFSIACRTPYSTHHQLLQTTAYCSKLSSLNRPLHMSAILVRKPLFLN